MQKILLSVNICSRLVIFFLPSPCLGVVFSLVPLTPKLVSCVESTDVMVVADTTVAELVVSEVAIFVMGDVVE